MGSGFNENDSIFDVPISGVYVFTWTIVPEYNTYIQVQLMVNGVVKGASFSDSQEIHDIHPASATVVLHVNQGDHVSLRRGLATKGVVRVDPNHATNTFAGWLLFE